MPNQVRDIWKDLMKDPKWKKIARDTLHGKKGATANAEKKIKLVIK